MIQHRYPLPSRESVPGPNGYFTRPWTFNRAAIRALLTGAWFDGTAEFASRDDAFLCMKLCRLLELEHAAP